MDFLLTREVQSFLKELMNPITYRYPLDPTGTSPDNLVEREEHQLSNRTIRVVAPKYQGFYAKSVIVTDIATNTNLVHGVDFAFGELYKVPTGLYKKEIFGVIVIRKPNVSSVRITYQCLGGNYSYSMDAIVAMLDNLNLGNRPVAWPDIIGKPTLFDPASHFHDIGDVYGFEYVVNSLEAIRSAILLGDTASHDEIYRYVDRASTALTTLINQVRADLVSHIADKGNPHQTTKAQVGLSNVANYTTATVSQIAAATPNLYTTADTVQGYVNANAIAPMNVHIANTSNPHQTTATQVGLGLVQNYGIASYAQMVAGTAGVYATPNTVKQYVADVAVNPLAEHVNDIGNPHRTTKAQVGLGSVDNYATATPAIAQAGISNSTFMTPQLVRTELQRLAITPLSNHVNDSGNPHQVTKAQVGLGSVANYPPATQAQMNSGVDGVYPTPLVIANYVTQTVGEQLRVHTSNVANPHNTTKAQVGLGSVDNYATATQAQMNAGTAGLFVTPNLVTAYVTQTVGLQLSNHTGRTDNPHQVTKAQVGLSNVNNFSLANIDIAAAGRDNGTYMTPFLTRAFNDALFPVYFRSHKADLQDAYNGTRDDIWMSPWLTAESIRVRLGNYYDRADVNYLIAQAVNANQYVITSSTENAVYTYSSNYGLNRSYNFFDVFPPAGKSMANLQGFISSPCTVYFAGDVDKNDTLYCTWQALGDRVRVWTGNSEQRYNGSGNYLAIWR